MQADNPIRLTIDGANISSVTSFYQEINRVFMTAENWRLGDSLDALNDMLYGDYGAAGGRGPVEIRWLAMEQSREALGQTYFDIVQKIFADHPRFRIIAA